MTKLNIFENKMLQIYAIFRFYVGVTNNIEKSRFQCTVQYLHFLNLNVKYITLLIHNFVVLFVVQSHLAISNFEVKEFEEYGSCYKFGSALLENL